MMLDNVKKEVSSNIGKRKKFVFYGSRNQVDEFEGVILNCYPALFVVEVSDSQIKSFSYSDLLIGSLKIFD